MKILHTSDWHLGHVLYNHERTEEQQSMLEQIQSIVETHKPDLFLLCGDVYHTTQPSSSVQTMFAESILKIHQANPEMQIVITAGNHDSAMKHEIFRKPWQYLNVHAIGSINRNNISEQIIEIPNKAFVIAIPYTYERNIPEKFHQSLLQEVEKRNTNNLPVIMSAHTTILGCDFSGHERADEKIVGGIESISLENIGEGFDYLALGHIHKPQFIHNSEKKARYCGTPLPITFDETYQHSVSLVEIDSHGEIPKVEIINIENPHPLVNLPNEGFQTWDKVKELLKEYPADQQDYIRLNIQVEDLLPATVKLEIENISREKQYKFCCVNIERTNHSHEEIKSLSVEEFQAEAPIEIATKYAQQTGRVFDEEMQGLFQEVLNIIEEDNRNN